MRNGLFTFAEILATENANTCTAISYTKASRFIYRHPLFFFFCWSFIHPLKLCAVRSDNQRHKIIDGTVNVQLKEYCLYENVLIDYLIRY